jgi:hypothetical protein
MLKRVIFVGCLILLTAGTVWSADDTFPMPEDMLKLMPADPAFIFAVTSVNDLDQQWQLIEEMLDDGSADNETIDLIDMFREEIPHFDEYADPDRPLAVVVGLPDMMGEAEPGIIFIVPIRESFTDREELGIEGVDILFEGNYLAISSTPGYAPATVIPELARNLTPGFVTARLDLEMILATYGPMVEMGLAAMPMGPATPDTSETGEIVPAAGMTPEEAAALGDMARTIMASALRLDLALRVEGETLTLHSGFAVSAGSPLDPGPQPSFEDALQLTRLLPSGGNIIQTMAMDQTRQFEVFKGYYLASLNRATAGMPPEQGAAYRAWVENYVASMDLFANPLAASMRMSSKGMTANMVMDCADPPATLERFAGLFDGLSAADIGIRLKKMPTGKVAGAEVRSWVVEYDEEKLAELGSDPMNPQLSGAGRLQAEQMVAILRKVTPNVNMATRGNYLILSADPNPANLAHMIQMAGQRRGAANPEVAAIAAKTGPACQQVVVGDLMAILAWITEWMEELNEKEYAAIKGNPIPFTGAFTIEVGNYGADWSMDMPAVQRFVKAMTEMEAFEDLYDNDDVAPDLDDAPDVDEVDETPNEGTEEDG